MKEPIYEGPDDIRIPDDLLDHPDCRCVIDAIKHRKTTAGLDEADATIIDLGRQMFHDRKVTPETFARAKALFGPHKLVDLVGKTRKQFSAAPASAAALATKPLGPAPKDMNVVDLAAWTVVANVLLNLDETLAKR